MPKMPKIISIMGNIGSGKTTVVNRLNDLGVYTFEEPLDEWKDWLDLFYGNPTRYGFSFQMKILYDYNVIKNQINSKNIDKCVIERSPFESKNIFAKALYKTGDMDEHEYHLFTKYFEEYSWKPDIIIYLKVSPERCLERIKLRNRECESEIELSYLDSLNDNYEELISNPEHNIHIIDADRSIDEILHEINSLI